MNAPSRKRRPASSSSPAIAAVALLSIAAVSAISTSSTSSTSSSSSLWWCGGGGGGVPAAFAPARPYWRTPRSRTVASAAGKGFGPPEGGGGGGGDTDGGTEMKKPKSKTTAPSASASSSASAPLGGGTFELQELRANLSSILKRSLSPRDVPESKRTELSKYVKAVALRVPSPIPPSTLATEAREGRLKGRWRLGYSTERAALGDLPAGANVVVEVMDEKRLEYKLVFKERVWGLREIMARSDYIVDPGPLNPGLLTYVYDQIVTDVFGLTIPVGLFGLLKGRANVIETVWYDGSYWFDRGFDVDGTEYYNVFVREEEGE